MEHTNEELVKLFTVWDYIVFGAMLFISAAIGLYYGCSGGKQKTTSEFLMADRSMGAFPVSLSLLASFMSAITLLGTPTEMYRYNSSYWLVGIAYCMLVPIVAYFYLPVFYRLRLTSANEYLELRFNKTIRRCASFAFIIQMTTYVAIVMYAPALALSQVTGLKVWTSVAAIGIVCTFYTTLGGMKAVMWTNAFQIFIMFGAIIAVIIKGSMDVGGFDIVWQRASQGNRLEFLDFSPDPTVRHSVWGLTIGATVMWLAIYGVNQAQVQRYLTTPTMKIAQVALWWNLIGLIALLSICCMAGLVIYANYWECDPLSTKRITKPDQLLPLFVMDTLGPLPGAPGFFVAGIFSGALSTISSGWNSLAAVTLEDFVRCCFPRMTDHRATLVSKFLAFFYGVLCIGLVAVAEQLGNILQAALSIFGIVGGPLLGVFSLGIFFPFANSIGAGVGLLSGFLITFWIAIGAQMNKDAVATPNSNMSISGCFFNQSFIDAFNISTTIAPNTDSEVLAIYKLSYLWYSSIACVVVISIGSVLSFATGFQNPDDLDPLLISPIYDVCCCCISEKVRRIFRCGSKKEPSPTEVELNGIKHKS